MKDPQQQPNNIVSTDTSDSTSINRSQINTYPIPHLEQFQVQNNRTLPGISSGTVEHEDERAYRLESQKAENQHKLEQEKEESREKRIRERALLIVSTIFLAIVIGICAKVIFDASSSDELKKLALGIVAATATGLVGFFVGRK
jgi:hypothetical protein